MRGFKRFGDRGLLVPDAFGSERRALLGRNRELTMLTDLSILPQTVHSVRKRAPKARYCMKLRKSSGGTRDFGFYGIHLDWWKVATWAGSDSVFVDTWYDQMGTGLDFVQPTTTRQPRLFDAGLRDLNGPFFSGSGGSSMGIASYTMGTPVLNFYFKGSVTVIAGAAIILESTTAAATVGQAFAAYALTSNGFVVDCYNGASQNRAATFVPTTWLIPPYRHLFAGLMDRNSGAMATDVLSRVNGVGNTSFSGSTDQTGNFSTTSLNLMGRDALGGGPSLLMKGVVEELVIYTSAATNSIAADIEAILRDV